MATENELYALSDDELATFDFDSIELEGTSEEEHDESESTHEEEDSQESSDAGELDGEESDDEDDAVNEGSEEDEEGNADSDLNGDADEETDEEDDTESDSSETYDMGTELSKLLSKPIKAGGREITINSAEEAVTLIQRGLGYYKSVAELKPLKRFTDALNQHGLLNDENVNYLVDLAKGDINAVKKLIRDNNIDLGQFDEEDNSQYTPKQYVADQVVSTIADVMDSIKESKHYNDTVSTVQSWDANSRAEIGKDPQIIAAVNSLMETGKHDKIMGELTKLRILDAPELSGKSDLEAYMYVGNELYGKGKTTDVQQSQLPNAGKRQPDNTKSSGLPKRNGGDKKRAGKPRGKAPQNVSLDSLSKLSDEEFESKFSSLF